ncbi:MAG TPA: D-alanine--D-alanine ligase family protein [Acidobacteriaceae bacterium]|jgi:D-alanine-D-alanine ligase|nr:D-alanine--D-alanine ligase family protein [Acidobacteriaceae bacterium]
MKKKLRVGILFGGRSGEHEISLLSAGSILKAIDRKKYDVVPIGIDKQGKWLTGEKAQKLIGEPASKESTKTLMADSGAALAEPSSPLAKSLDVVFPVLHGTFGEDGTIQGLFELADIAYVGSGVLGSSAGMDKDAMKRLFAAAGLPQTPYVSVLRSAWRADAKGTIRTIEKSLAYPLFVKPANLGSSVGISKVHDRAELGPALDVAASFDRKIVVEEGVGGPGVKPRELEVSVLGNDEPEASAVGEIVPNKEFYDYESKYADSPENPSVPIIPAKLTKAQVKRIQQMAVAAFRACDCAGLARVDFLMEPERDRKGKKIGSPGIYLNEINTMPGFTSISMYPKLWQASGIGYSELIDRLIALALERHREKQETRFSKA